MDIVSAGVYNFSAFVLIISVIVFIHELGHYAVAKYSGVKIEVFSIGFGREIFGWNDRSGTRWRVAWLPFGGYVKMFGDANAASVPDQEASLTKEEERYAFSTQTLGVKAAVVVAGPLANFILSILILTVVFSFVGRAVSSTVISEVEGNSAAYEAGLEVGDIIVSLDGEHVSRFDDIQRIVSINIGDPIDVGIRRGDDQMNITITPQMVEAKDAFGNDIVTPRLGIRHMPSGREELGLVDAFIEGIRQTYHITSSTLVAVGQMITGDRGASDISGPIGIAQYSGQSLSQGWLAVFWFMAVLSANLGLINLFPIPLLDGGHLMYYAIEAVRGRPMAERFQMYGFKVGMIFIVGLAIFAILNDVRKLGGF